MDGELPSTFWQGLLSGFGHPVIGLDHLAFVVAVGLLSGLAGHLLLLSCVFIAGTIAGCAAHLLNLSLPFSELVIALTVCAAGLMIVMRLQLSTPTLSILFAIAGVFHGYAYGESIVGAERTPLAAYIAGFSLVQYCISVGAATGLHFIVRNNYVSEGKASKVAGGVIVLVAAAILLSPLVGV
jgi:urease accessory protein